MNIPDLNQVKKPIRTARYFKYHFPEFYEFLNETYKNHNLTFSEMLYWYYNGLTERPVCVYCGKPTKFENTESGYRKYCSYKCLNADPNKKEKVEATCMEKFGTKAPAQNKDVLLKMEQTNLQRYGETQAMKNPMIAMKSKDALIKKYGGCGNAVEKIKEKYKQTNIERYGVDNYASTRECRDKMKETCLERYGVDSYSKTDDFKNELASQQPEIRDKVNIAKKANGTFNTSSIEESFTAWLIKNNIKFERQYRDPDRYPFNCDFYFPDKDLFLEIQGSWTHGGHPFDPNNEDDINQLNAMRSKNSKYYDNAIYTWTELDVRKRQTAKKNGLNWVEVFGNDIQEVIKEYAKH